MEKTQLHHKATLTYTFQEVGTISFMAFSPGKFYRTMNSTIDFNVLLHGFPSLILEADGPNCLQLLCKVLVLSNLIARSIYDFWNAKVAATAAGPSLFCCDIGLPQEVNLLTDLLMNVQR